MSPPRPYEDLVDEEDPDELTLTPAPMPAARRVPGPFRPGLPPPLLGYRDALLAICKQAIPLAAHEGCHAALRHIGRTAEEENHYYVETKIFRPARGSHMGTKAPEPPELTEAIRGLWAAIFEGNVRCYTRPRRGHGTEPLAPLLEPMEIDYFHREVGFVRGLRPDKYARHSVYLVEEDVAILATRLAATTTANTPPAEPVSKKPKARRTTTKRVELDKAMRAKHEKDPFESRRDLMHAMMEWTQQDTVPAGETTVRGWARALWAEWAGEGLAHADDD